ncbi:MAG TPA: ATP-binding protein, partial [Gemmatimonadaceae bacterium]|nr:ATP-binding protein [Gemmatimonadaceae bacterium]
LEHASDAIFLLDASGTISYVSPSTERLTSRASVALLGKRLVDLIHPEDRDAVRAALESIGNRPRSPAPFRYRVELPETGWRTFSAIGRNLLDEDVVGGIIVNARDVTEQEKAENLFRQSQKMEALGQLVGGIAHDFNNLLTVMTVSSSMLLEDLGADDSRRADVQEICDATERAAALTNQLLVFSRKQVMQPRNIRLNESIEHVQRLLRRLIGDDIELSTALDEDLAAIHADPGQIEQVLINLVVNARDAMPEGGKIRIATSNVELAEQREGRRVGAPAGKYVLLSVSDTGSGMTPEVQEHLFEPFFTTKEQGKGTGLGLSTVHGIVKQSGGDLWVYSEIGQGTTFKVYFPALSSDAAPDPDRTSAQPVKRGRETVLLVEDDAKLILLSARILEGLDYTVMLARNGQEALEIIAAHGDRINVVVTDVVMPVMSGRPLIEKLREIYPELRFLFMSGYTADEVTRRGILEGQSPFLQKPFTPEQLGRKIREVLDQPAHVTSSKLAD